MKKGSLTIIVMVCALLCFLCNGLVAQQAKSKVDPTKWIVIQSNGKYGFLDKTGKVVIQPTFDFAAPFTKDGLTEVESDEGWGLIDKTGKWKIQPKYQWLSHCDTGLWWAQLDGNLGFIDKTGKWIEVRGINTYFEATRINSNFHDGLAAVKINDLWGFVDKTSKLVIEAQFSRIVYEPGFQDGVCVVQVGGNSTVGTGKCGIIDNKGNWVVPAQYPYMGVFCEGLVAVASGEKVGFMDKTGKWVIQPQFDLHNRYKEYGENDGGRTAFCEGLATVLLNGKYGAIDKTGKWVIEPQFDDYFAFRDGYACVIKDDKEGVIDKKGNWVIQPTYCGIQNYSAAKNQFVANNCDGERLTGEGVIDATGKIIIPLKYGLVVYKGELYRCSDYNHNGIQYYIDLKGKIVYQTND